MLLRIFTQLNSLIDGDLVPFGGQRVDDHVAGRIRAGQIAPLVRYTPAMMLGNICNAIVLGAALWPSPSRLLAIAWAIMMVSVSLLVLVRARRTSHSVKPHAISRRALRNAVMYATILGALWGILPLLFFAGASPDARLVMMILGSGMLSAGAFALGSVPMGVIGFVAPIFAGYAIGILVGREPGYTLVALLMVCYTFVLIRAAVVHALQLAAHVIAQVEVEHLASNDPLTNLPNRNLFNENLNVAVARLERYSEGFAVLYCDLDEFKSVNDRLGHAAGDALLVQAADRLRACVRTVDTVARLGGDEFAMIQASVLKIEDAFIMGERIIEAFSTPFMIEGLKVPATISVGIALAPTDGTTADTLVKNADIALYLSKRSGRGTFRMFEPVDDASARERRALEQDLRNAMPNGELRLDFQPLIDLSRDVITGFEALLRWEHPTRGLIQPGTFIPLAERTGLILPIGAWVVEEACRVASTWPTSMRVAVNFSAQQFRSAEIVDTVRNALDASGLDARRLEIEITESLLMTDSEKTFAILAGLQRTGVRVALDDFGTGYSSLEYLRVFPFDRIKIDRSFTADVTQRREAASIVRFLIGLAKDLEIAVTAEGVETIEQLAFLDKAGCREAQGYLIGMPQAAEAAKALANSLVSPRTAMTRAA